MKMKRYVLWINGQHFCGYFESREEAEKMVELIIKTTKVDFFNIFEEEY